MKPSFFDRLRPGIRGKLSLFTGLMLAGLIAAVLAAAVRQQNDSLASRAEEEVARYLAPVESLTLEVDHLAEALIHIERLRGEADRARARDQEARYFRPRDLERAEDELRQLIRPSPSSEPVDERRFVYLQTLARRVIDATPEKTNFALPRKQFEEELRASLEYNSRIDVAFRGLDLRRFRAESIDLYRWPRFDTALLLPPRERRRSPINDFLWGRTPELRATLDALYRPYIADRRPLPSAAPSRLSIDDREYLLVSRTFFRRPELSRRAELILKTLPRDGAWRRFAAREQELNTKLAELGQRLLARSAALAEEKPDLAPGLDADWRSISGEYRRLLGEREQLASEAARLYLEKTDRLYLEAAPEDQPEELPAAALTADAFTRVREAALLRQVAIRLAPDLESYDNYRRSARSRAIEAARWKATREWILNGRSPVYGAPALGLQLLTRRQAEEAMVALDAAALSAISETILYQETAGFTRILADSRAYQAELDQQSSRLIDTALSIALRFVFLAFLFSDFFVRTIRRIIAGASEVGAGNLNVRFAHGGKDELAQLAASLNEMVKGLKEREELRGELSAAEEIQKRLIPEAPPAGFDQELSFGAFYKAMIGVGGDYYDFLPTGRGEFVFCVADVSNHGVGPAIVMTMLRAHLHAIVRRGERNVKAIALELNARAYADTPENIFITLCLGLYRARDGAIDYISCGHLAPLLVRYRDGEVVALKAGGLPIGAVDNDLFESMIEPQKAALGPGDLFFLYTDGLTEAMNQSDELFGDDRLLALLRENSRKKPPILMQLIAEAVQQFSGKRVLGAAPSELNDDLAMIAFRRLRQEKPT